MPLLYSRMFLLAGFGFVSFLGACGSETSEELDAKSRFQTDQAPSIEQSPTTRVPMDDSETLQEMEAACVVSYIIHRQYFPGHPETKGMPILINGQQRYLKKQYPTAEIEGKTMAFVDEVVTAYQYADATWDFVVEGEVIPTQYADDLKGFPASSRSADNLAQPRQSYEILYRFYADGRLRSKYTEGGGARTNEPNGKASFREYFPLFWLDSIERDILPQFSEQVVEIHRTDEGQIQYLNFGNGSRRFEFVAADYGEEVCGLPRQFEVTAWNEEDLYFRYMYVVKEE